jgi:pimeloyl-[acyl-carrier protein] synthase
MPASTGTPPTMGPPDPTLSLYRLLTPQVRANPYPLYERLRTEDPVHWDPFLHAWVVTRYADVVAVLHDGRFSAHRTPTPEHLTAMGLGALSPIAQVMVRQMLFMDPPAHTRLRNLTAKAFTPRRVERLRPHIQDIVDDLLDRAARRAGPRFAPPPAGLPPAAHAGAGRPVGEAHADSPRPSRGLPAQGPEQGAGEEPSGRRIGRGRMDVIADLAYPLPAIVTAEMLGVPTSDCDHLKAWSADFATMLGNFEHNPDHAPRVRRSLEEMTAYFRAAIRRQQQAPREGLIHALVTAEHEGDRLSEDEVIANVIITMVGGQETTTSMIGNGLLTLLHHPHQWQQLRTDPSLIPSAIEEILRYESPIQHTARMTAVDLDLGGKRIRQRQAVIAVLGAANRDPERFPDPNRFDIGRLDNRHVAFGWAGHFCFGAPLARLEGQIAFETLLRRRPTLELEPGPPSWQDNLCYRGLTALPVTF